MFTELQKQPSKTVITIAVTNAIGRSFSLSLSIYIYIYIYVCVCVCVCLCVCVGGEFTNVSTRAGHKQILTNLNSEFSFS